MSRPRQPSRVVEMVGVPITASMVSVVDDGTWSFSLFSCFDNCGLLWATMLCPCVIFGQMMDRAQFGGFWGCCLLYSAFPCISWYVRGEIRRKYTIKGSRCEDVLKHMFCHPFALFQEACEIASRTFNA
eukprot:TRINITY_DN776100_c0_g1_i1.p1 TRINITY_DN776100_c0_g1~~TRINITY_DN776100_c0_g1_i1.p1  ORF type:complete len:129 (+),score=6.33 TRINITY_DN776100_c0_g1_i1:142-528(+)